MTFRRQTFEYSERVARRMHFSMIVAAALGALSALAPLRAEDDADDDASADTEVFSRGGLVVTFDGGSPDIDNWVQELELSRGGALTRSPVMVLSASSPLFLDAFRRQLIPARELIDDVMLRFCRPQSPLFSELIEEAGLEVRRGALTKAGETLANAREALACGIDVATPEVLARMMLYSGIVHMAAGDAEGLFEDAFNIDPNVEIPTTVKPVVLRRMKRARRTASNRPRVDVSLWTGDMAGLRLRIDGREPAAPTFNIPAGRHVVQLIGPDGLAFGGAIVRLREVEGAVQWPPPDLRPLPPMALVQELRAATLEPRLDPLWIERMETYRKTQGFDWLVIDPGPDYNHLYWFWPGGLAERMMAPSRIASSTSPGHAQENAGKADAIAGAADEKGRGDNDSDGMLIPDDEREPSVSGGTDVLARELPVPPSRFSGAVTSSVLGVAGVVAATIYFQARAEVEDTLFPTYEEGEAVRRKGFIAGFASVALLSGSAISAGVTMLAPRPREEAVGVGVRDETETGRGGPLQSGVVLGVGGQW